jgi:hypothetical protein
METKSFLSNLWVIFATFCLLLVGCEITVKEEVVAPASNGNPNTNIPSIVNYGIVYAYPGDAWDESDRPAIRERLTYLRSLGVNTVIQVFSGNMMSMGTEQNWLIFLDEAQRADIQVVARLYPSNEGNGKNFNYQDIDKFLQVVQEHPALLAYLGLHEPLEQMGSKQLQSFYRHIKEVAPNVRVAHYLDDMAWFEASLRFPGRRFDTEICDICIIWYYPALYEGDVPAFDLEHLQNMVRANRALVNERSPDSELWFLGQTYSSKQSNLRMPSTEEMKIIFDVASQEGVDGFLWYPWLHDQYDKVLSDPEMEAQRELIKTIYETYNSQIP